MLRALLTVVAVLLILSDASIAAPRCFGAATRDPESPCVNPELSFTAIPSPDEAPLEPSAPCTPTRRRAPQTCAFGAPQKTATATVALIGDSHSTHWRAALAVVAATERWHGVSINRNACPFTFATTPGPGRCTGWAGSVLGWLQAHPEVHTVFVSANSGSAVRPLAGVSWQTTKIGGYTRAWKALPRSVHRIFVIRDVPHSSESTQDCVARAVARQRNPAVRCARPRVDALRPDLEAVAAEQTDSERVALIDLTPFMCDEESCFPVVGGALVVRDVGHLTRAFSASLGPYLDRAISAAGP